MAQDYSSLQASYRSNPSTGIVNKPNYGRKILDDYGNWSYEGLLATDDFGNRYDPRINTGDRDGSK